MSFSLRSTSSLTSIAGTGLESTIRKRLDFPTGSCGVCLPALSRRTGSMATDGQPAHATLPTLASSRKPTRVLAHPPTSGRAAIDVARAKSPTPRALTRAAAAAGCLHRLHITPKTLSSPVSNVFVAAGCPVFRPSIRSAKSRRADRAGPPPARSPPANLVAIFAIIAEIPRTHPAARRGARRRRSPRYPCEPLASRLPPERAACPRAAGPLGYGSQPSHGTRGEAQQ